MEITTPLGVRKGAWTSEEDLLLKEYIDKYGEGKWHQVPLRAGLNRCRKSCRLRWLNYLKPTIKRGDFALDEADLIIRLHNLLGNRWSLIAGRLPGRTANDVKNYWNTRLRKKQVAHEGDDERAKSLKNTTELSKIIKPRPQRFSGNLASLSRNTTNIIDNNIILRDSLTQPSPTSTLGIDENPWWDNMLVDNGVTWFMSVSNHEELVTIGSFSGEDVATGVEASDNSFVQEGKNGWNDISIDHVELWDLK